MQTIGRQAPDNIQLGVTVNTQTGCRGLWRHTGQRAGEYRGKPQSWIFCIRIGIRVHCSSSLPLVPGCFCCKPGTPTVSRWHEGRTGCGWGPLEAGAREEKEEGKQSFKEDKGPIPTSSDGEEGKDSKPSYGLRKC